MADFKDILMLARPLGQEEQERLQQLSHYLEDEELKIIKRLLKQKKASIIDASLDIVSKQYWLLEQKHDSASDFVSEINDKIREKIKQEAHDEFSINAFDKIKGMIAPNLVGFDSVKKAALLQLFAPDHVHILLIGDPGTGKTDVLRSASDLHPISSFGLGSGTSSSGLAVTIRGNEVMKGLLPMADKGLACIDELNLMKKEDMASLYNAMEKGFITYDKAGHHHRFDARISVLSTANPKGDKFVGSDLANLKRQLPFDSALLTRFHLVFFVRKPDTEKFKEIAKSIVKDKKINIEKKDIDFVKEYISKALSIDVKVPSTLEKEIVDFAAELKKDEHRYLVEISPRLVIGFIRMAKAAARMELRDSIESRDIELVKGLVRESLLIR